MSNGDVDVGGGDVDLWGGGGDVGSLAEVIAATGETGGSLGTGAPWSPGLTPPPTPAPSWWSSFGNVAKAALPFIQVGSGLTGVAGSIMGMRQLAEQTDIAKSAEKRRAGIAKTAEAAAGPVRAFGEQELAQAQAGKIDPAIEKEIQLWVQGAKQKANDYAARSGQGDSQQLVDWLNWIDQMGQAMRTQAIQGEQQLGLTAAGTAANILNVGAGAAGGAGDAAAGQQTSLMQLIAAANQELARLSAGAA